MFIGLLPLSTAIFAVIRGGERPKAPFWLFSIAGSVFVAGFPGTQGAALSRRLGGWQVISWALLFSFPFMAILAITNLTATWVDISTSAWIGLGYVSVFSMFVGFIFSYRGLAIGSIAGVSQLQLLQPFLGLAIAGFLLGETVALSMIGVTVLVISCVTA